MTTDVSDPEEVTIRVPRAIRVILGTADAGWIYDVPADLDVRVPGAVARAVARKTPVASVPANEGDPVAFALVPVPFGPGVRKSGSN